MGRIVAQDFEPFGLLAGDDRDRGVMVDDGREIARPPVDLDRDRRLGQTRPDRGRQLGAGQRRREIRGVLPSGRVTTTGPNAAGSIGAFKI